MTINDISNLFMFVGGLGMFLYGMHSMSEGIQKSAGQRMHELLGIFDQQPLYGDFDGSLDYGHHPEQRCHHGYGRRFCKCRHHVPDTGSGCNHGCQYRYLYHGMDRISWTVRRCVQSHFPVTLRTSDRGNRRIYDYVQQKAEKTNLR